MWTTGKSIVEHLKRLWDRGVFLSTTVTGKNLFPLAVPLKAPTSDELSARFAEAREWVAALHEGSFAIRGKGYRVQMKRINHRVLGSNELPSRVWVDGLEDALFLLNKKREAALFQRLVEETEQVCPALLAHLAHRPMRALSLSEEWGKLLSVALCIYHHPRSGFYLRQMDLPGVHTKFIEGNQAVLSEMLERLSPGESRDGDAPAGASFARRYGFASQPLLVRFRLPRENSAFPTCVSDVSLPSDEFAQLNLVGSNVLVVENKINFLSLPRMRDTLIIWGAGYGFENLASARWLTSRATHYWGDIDTHGFAILNQFRSIFPSARSFLMDRETLIQHKELWVEETTPTGATLPNLTDEESALYQALVRDTLGERVRLEQERIGYGWIMSALAAFA